MPRYSPGPCQPPDPGPNRSPTRTPSSLMVPSSPVTTLAIAVFLVLVTVPIARKVAATEGDPRLYRIIMATVITHLLFTVIQVWVVDHVYHGITDYTRYVDQGATLAPRFDAFNFSLTGTNITVLGSGAVGVAAGIVFAIVGVNKLAGFFVFSWFGFFSALLFYRAFAITFPEGDRRRYAFMILFLPSLLFWTAGISKETLMIMSLAVCSYGAARILPIDPAGHCSLPLGWASASTCGPRSWSCSSRRSSFPASFGAKVGSAGHFGVCV